jgi:hypothetical protein
MKYIVSFFQFWYDFIVGDDWTIAAAVGAALLITWLLTHNSHVNVWWILPLVVVCALAGSLWREAAKAVRR